ncbi:MAG TPA: hypothetical protein VM077_05765 [Candidatus Limnocylindrales bacterium]|nr:hypothetical protein [Candidatus Limnocylindrales bacterium]
MARPEDALDQEEHSRVSFTPLSDAWISGTISMTFTAAGIDSPYPVRRESMFSASPLKTVLPYTDLIPDALIDGEEISILNPEPQKSMFQSILAVAKDRREAWETRTTALWPEGLNYSDLAMTLQQNIIFTVATLRKLGQPGELDKAIGKVARENWNNCVKTGIRSEETNRRVSDNIGFAVDVFRLQRKIRTS